MFTSPPRHARAAGGFTLVEVMVASALGLLATTAILMLWMFSARSFVAATNYTDLALASRNALDTMSRSIRQASRVTAYTSNSISFQDVTGQTFSYAFNPTNHTLVSVVGSQIQTNLTSCDSLQFWIYQRTPKSNTFAWYTPANKRNAKLVQVTWTCSRTILGTRTNSEAIESAKIVLRNH